MFRDHPVPFVIRCSQPLTCVPEHAAYGTVFIWNVLGLSRILEERNKDAPTRAWIQNLQSSEASLIFYLKSPDAQKHQETGLPPCHPADLGLGPSEEDREGNGNPL